MGCGEVLKRKKTMNAMPTAGPPDCGDNVTGCLTGCHCTFPNMMDCASKPK